VASVVRFLGMPTESKGLRKRGRPSNRDPLLALGGHPARALECRFWA